MGLLTINLREKLTQEEMDFAARLLYYLDTVTGDEKLKRRVKASAGQLIASPVFKRKECKELADLLLLSSRVLITESEKKGNEVSENDKQLMLALINKIKLL